MFDRPLRDGRKQHMNTNDTPTGEAPQTAWQLQHTAAVAALTSAHRAGFDMGEFICQVVTATAANAGGTEALLSVRTGSWEADFVRQIVHRTAGEAVDHLAAYRTEPVKLYFDAGALYGDLGLENLLYEEDAQNGEPLQEMLKAIPMDWYEDVPGPVLAWRRDKPKRLREDMTAGQRAYLDAAEELQDQNAERSERMERLLAADVIAYRANLREAALHHLGAYGLQDVPVEFVEGSRYDEEPTYSELGEVLEAIEEGAAQRAVVPPLGRPRAEIEGSVVDAVRSAGLTYTERDAAGERAPHTDEEEQA
jgi:hypothetical protein